MKKRLLTLFLVFAALWTLPFPRALAFQDGAPEAEQSGEVHLEISTLPVCKAIGNENIGKPYGGVSNVLHYVDEEDRFCFSVENGEMLDLYTTDKGRIVGQLSLPKAHPLVGRVLCDEQGYLYVVYGENNKTTDETVNTMFVTKYSKTGEELATVGYTSDGQTRYPFVGGNCAACLYNGTLMINYAQLMYNGHQSNWLMAVDTSTMTLKRGFRFFTSHSFEQRVNPYSKTGGFLLASKGDAMPRGFTVAITDEEKNLGSATTFHFWTKPDTASLGKMGLLNQTYSFLGNVFETSAGVMLIGCSAKSLDERAPEEMKQVFVQVFDPEKVVLNRYPVNDPDNYVTVGERSGLSGENGNIPTTDYGVKWLTEEDCQVPEVQAVKIDDDRVVLLFVRCYPGEYENQPINIPSYLILDGSGNVVGKGTLPDNVRLNADEQPVYANGAVCWTGNNSYRNEDNYTKIETEVSVFSLYLDGEKEAAYHDGITAGTCGEGVSYRLCGGVLRISGSGSMDDYASFDDAPYADLRLSIKKIEVGAGVKRIGAYAFEGLPYLSSVHMEEGPQEIGAYAFSGSRLKELTIPNSMKTLGECALYSNPFKEVTVLSRDVRMDQCALSSKLIICRENSTALLYAQSTGQRSHFITDDGLIYGSYGDFSYTLTKDGVLTVCGEGAIPGVRSSSDVPWNSLYGKVKRLILAEGVTGVGSNVVVVGGKRLDLPVSLVSCEKNSFNSSYYFEDVYYAGTLAQWCSIGFSEQGHPISGRSKLHIAGEDLRDLRLPDGITRVSSRAFEEYPDVTVLRIPKSVTSIEDGAFHRCLNLTEVFYEGSEEDFEKIRIEGNNASLINALFRFNCDPAKKNGFVNDGDGIRCYRNGAYLTGLVEIDGLKMYFSAEDGRMCTGSVEIDGQSFETTAFSYADLTLFRIVDPAECQMLYSGSWNGIRCILGFDGYSTEGCAEIVVPPTIDGEIVRCINDYAFMGSTAFTSLIFPDTIKEMRTYCICADPLLTELRIPRGVCYLNEAFVTSVPRLTRITVAEGNRIYKAVDNALIERRTGLLKALGKDSGIPQNAGITRIGKYACADRTNESITVPDGVEWIGIRAFSGCAQLRSVSLPRSLKGIDQMAFTDCPLIEEIFFRGTEEEWSRVSRYSNSYKNATVHFLRIDEIFDLDGSGSVDITDVTVLLNLLASNDADPAFDCDGSGSVNISDVTTLLNFLAAA